jgi:hypothetical protein
VVLSLDSAFIANAAAGPPKGKSAAEVKRDGARKALHRLRPRRTKTDPELPFVLALDSLYGCGPVFARAAKFHWSFVVTFTGGRTPAWWREYQALLRAGPHNVRRREWRAGLVPEFRGVPQLDYQASAGRWWKLKALGCTETTAAGGRPYFAGLTALAVGKKTVEEIAPRGGR